ncbi:MAG: P-II family nitrogen regulator [Elusimicrobiota bacterium]
MKKLEVIIRPGKLDAVKKAMSASGYTGVTISQAEGHGSQKGLVQDKAGGSYRMDLVPKLRMEVVVAEADAERLIEAISKAALTGEPGDGKIFISDVRDVVRIRTGERGTQAL